MTLPKEISKVVIINHKEIKIDELLEEALE